MARVVIKEEEFEEAREKLAQIGVILYRKKHKKGGYVCRASKKLKEMLENEETSLSGGDAARDAGPLSVQKPQWCLCLPLVRLDASMYAAIQNQAQYLRQQMEARVFE